MATTTEVYNNGYEITKDENLPYEVKAIKNVPNYRNGDGFTCKLYKGRKLIAHVTDDGNGGCYRWDDEDRDLHAEFRQYAEDKIGKGIERDDHFVALLVEEKEICQKAKRSKSKTIFKVKAEPDFPGYPDYTYFSIKGTGDRIKGYLESKYGDELIHVYQ